MKQIKIGIVGTSFGATFIPLFRAHPNVRAVAIADLLPERLQYAQDLYGAMETFHTLDEMLASDVDAVCIFTQRWMHAAQAMQAMGQTNITDLHLFCLHAKNRRCCMALRARM